MPHLIKTPLTFVCVASLLAGSVQCAESKKENYFGSPEPERSSNPALDESKNTAVIPMSKLEDGGFDWIQRHQQILALEKTVKPKVVLIGDSITHFWGGDPAGHIQNGPEAWEKTFGNRPVLNLGFAWDRTQNVLWRLDHGELDNIRPKVAVINLGMNNFIATENARANTPDEVAQGILAVCTRIRSKSFQTRIVVMGVFPRGDAANSETRAPIKALNALLAKALAGKPGILFLDIGSQFLAQDGGLDKSLMVDDTHPNEQGYAIWGEALIKAGILKE